MERFNTAVINHIPKDCIDFVLKTNESKCRIEYYEKHLKNINNKQTKLAQDSPERLRGQTISAREFTDVYRNADDIIYDSQENTMMTCESANIMQDKWLQNDFLTAPDFIEPANTFFSEPDMLWTPAKESRDTSELSGLLNQEEFEKAFVEPMREPLQRLDIKDNIRSPESQILSKEPCQKSSQNSIMKSTYNCAENECLHLDNHLRNVASSSVVDHVNHTNEFSGSQSHASTDNTTGKMTEGAQDIASDEVIEEDAFDRRARVPSRVSLVNASSRVVPLLVRHRPPRMPVVHTSPGAESCSAMIELIGLKQWLMHKTQALIVCSPKTRLETCDHLLQHINRCNGQDVTTSRLEEDISSIPEGGVLIVCSKPALESWAALIRASSHLRLLCYTESLAERRRRGARGAYQMGTAFYDVVITTFDILKAEEVHGFSVNDRPMASEEASLGCLSDGWQKQDNLATGKGDKSVPCAQSYLHMLRWNSVLHEHDEHGSARPTNAKGRALIRVSALQAYAMCVHTHDIRINGPLPPIAFSGVELKGIASMLHAQTSVSASVADLVFDARN